MITLAFAWAYVCFGSIPEVGWLLNGVKPFIIAVVAQAPWGLLRTAIKGPLLALYLLGFNEIAVLFGGAALVFTVEMIGLSYRCLT